MNKDNSKLDNSQACICPSCTYSTPNPEIIYKLSEFDGEIHYAVSCNRCKLKFMHPMPDPDFLSNHYKTRSLYGAESNFPEDYWNSISDKKLLFSELITPHIKQRNDIKCIDIGAGSGYVVRALKELGYSSLGIEINPEASTKAKALFDVEVSNIDLKSINDKSITVFSFFEVLEHIPRPIHFLEQLREKLHDDGLLIGTVPNYGGLGRILFGRKSSALLQPEHVIYFDKKTLANTLNISGYEVLFIGPKKPTQVVVGFGLRQLVIRIIGRNWLGYFIVNALGITKRRIVYPLLNTYVEKTGTLMHGLTFVARVRTDEAKRENRKNQLQDSIFPASRINTGKPSKSDAGNGLPNVSISAPPAKGEDYLAWT